MFDSQTRTVIMEALGAAVDSLVRDHYRGLSQEAAITSRIGQNMEARLDGQRVGDYTLRIITQDFPDRGPKSLEKTTGADLFISMSVDGDDGFDKAMLVQSKLDRNVSRAELQDQCRRMRQISRSSYVWIYTAGGVSVVSAKEVGRMEGNNLKGLQTRSVGGFFGRVLDCYAGSRSLGIPSNGDRRSILTQRLREFHAWQGIDVELEQSTGSKRAGHLA